MRCVNGKRGDLLGTVIESRAAKPKGLVILDPGGPGLPLLADDVPVSEVVPETLSEYAVGIPIEKWISMEADHPCFERIPVNQVYEKCNLEGLRSTAPRLNHFIRSAETLVKLPLRGVYAQSFGASRTNVLVDHSDSMRWNILESPSPLPGSSALSFIRHRVKYVAASLQRRCHGSTCRTKLNQGVSVLSSRGQGPEITAREFTLGVLGFFSAQPSAQQIGTLATQVLKNILKPETASLLRSLARNYSLTNGESDWRKSLGFWADFCPTFTKWSEISTAKLSMIRNQGSLFRPCIDWDAARPGVFARLEDTQLQHPTLVVASKADASVGLQQQLAWRDGQERVRAIFTRGHLTEGNANLSKIRLWIARAERDGQR